MRSIPYPMPQSIASYATSSALMAQTSVSVARTQSLLPEYSSGGHIPIDPQLISSHPFHKHNHKVWIIGQGEGGCPWHNVEEAIENGAAQYFNLVNPPYRDGFTLYSGNGRFVVVRYHIYFPAVSMIHCHMIYHFAVRTHILSFGSFTATSWHANLWYRRADSKSSCWRVWRSCHQSRRS
jgi:hypothetical protein